MSSVHGSLPRGFLLKDRYAIEAPIGKGGFGTVYLALDTRLSSKRVVVKFLREAIDRDSWFYKKYRQEVEALSRIEHPGVLSVLDTGETSEGMPYIVTPFVNGVTLRSQLSPQGMELKRAARIIRQAAAAIDAAHEAHVYHRDLKPENILLQTLPDEQEHVILIDFGIATVRGTSGETETIHTLISGSTEYMAPEQLMGEPQAASDIYALGVITYEMITGRRPYEAASPAKLYSMQAAGSPARPGELRPDLPPAIDAIIFKALSFDSSQRFDRAREFADAFEASLAGAPFSDSGHLPTTTAPPETASWLTRRRAAAAVLGTSVAAIGGWQLLQRFTTGPRIESVAILPFVNVTAAQDVEYVSDGLTESLINNLGQISDLRVMSRSAVFPYKGSGQNPQSIGRSLNVRAVLTGRVTLSGQTLTVTTELVDVSTNQHLWGQSYRRKLSEIAAVQEDIAQEIAQRLRLQLSPREKTLIARRHTNDAEAHRLYMLGLYHWNKRTQPDLLKATELFQSAVSRDSRYALAYVGISNCYALRSGAMPPKEAFGKAREAAGKALELDDGLAEAHASMAFINLYHDWNWIETEKQYRRAIELNTSYPTAHSMYGMYLIAMKRFDEAIREMRRALEFDPASWSVNTGLGRALYYARRYPEAEAQQIKTLELNAEFAEARFDLGSTCITLGKYKEGIEHLKRGLAAGGTNAGVLAHLVWATAKSGDRTGAAEYFKALEEVAAKRYVSPYIMAIAREALGQREEALKALNQGVEDRAWAMIMLDVDPKFDGLRGDPRFQDVLRRVGLT
jgi:serine/threonine-protein kinase